MHKEHDGKSELGRRSQLVLAACFILVGGLFLLGNFIEQFSIGHLWPLFMLIPVVILIMVWLEHKREAAGVVFPIVLLGSLALYFLYLNFSGWRNIASSWPFFLIAPGLGFVGLWLVYRHWAILIPAGILLFTGAALFGLSTNSGVLLAVLLIISGLLLLGKNILPLARGQEKSPANKKGGSTR